MELAEKIQRLRGGRSNADLAAACGCSPTNIQNIARAGRQPGFAIGVRLAATLGVPADWLADDELDWPPPKSEKDEALELVGQALTGVGLAGELSKAEREVLAQWRMLDGEGQAEIRGYLRGMTTGRS